MVNAPPQSGAVLCFGDSLVVSVGADTPEERYPYLLAKSLHRKVRARGTAGQTTKEGLKAIKAEPNLTAPVVIVTLGGNDILKQINWARTEENLAAIFKEFQARGALVVLTAVEGPISGSRGKRYRALCRQHGVILVPDILGEILGDQDLKADAIHPNGAGYQIMAAQVAEVLGPFLTERESAGEED